VLLVATRAPKGYRFFKNGDSASKWKRYHPHIVRPLARPVPTTYIFFIFQNLEEIDSCARESTAGTTTPYRMPSVLSRVGAEMGPTFWKLQECAAFRQMQRYQLHFAQVVAFSFCFGNGAPAEKWKMGAYGEKRRYQQHLECLLGMTENDATMQPWASRVWGPFTSVCGMGPV